MVCGLVSKFEVVKFVISLLSGLWKLYVYIYEGYGEVELFRVMEILRVVGFAL